MKNWIPDLKQTDGGGGCIESNKQNIPLIIGVINRMLFFRVLLHSKCPNFIIEALVEKVKVFVLPAGWPNIHGRIEQERMKQNENDFETEVFL